MPPVFAHGQLRLYLLAMLEAGPRHGYQVITALSERFGGTYRPSAGTIYPRLARLEEEGLVARREQGRKTLYELTSAGRAELAAHATELAALEQDLAETVRQRAEQVRTDVTGALAGVRAELSAAARRARDAAAAAPTAVGAAPTGEGRHQVRMLRAEAETELTLFREDLKVMLRQAERAGTLGRLTVDTLRTVLDGARTVVRDTLPR